MSAVPHLINMLVGRSNRQQNAPVDHWSWGGRMYHTAWLKNLASITLGKSLPRTILENLNLATLWVQAHYAINTWFNRQTAAWPVMIALQYERTKMFTVLCILSPSAKEEQDCKCEPTLKVNSIQVNFARRRSIRLAMSSEWYLSAIMCLP